MSYEIKVHFVQASGATSAVRTVPGTSVMRAALDHGVSGIIAECGGDCTCATCHVYVDDGFAGRLSPVGDDEREMLEGVAADLRPTSRLSCQISLTLEHDGLTVQIPDTQY